MRSRLVCPALAMILSAALPAHGGEGSLDLSGVYQVAAEIELGEDADGDGLTDEWETTHFGNLRDQMSTDDPDADGQNNLAEMQAGTSPVDPSNQ